jgi:hypothetical protein
MRAALALGLVLGGPAAAEGLCDAVWSDLSQRLADHLPLTGTVAAMDGDWCVVEGVVLDLPGTYTPDLHADRLRFRGSALDWALDGVTPPLRFEASVQRMRLAIQTGDAQMDYLFAAQARANPMRADLALAWDPVARALSVERLEIDFPGENLVQLTARLAGVDLSSTGAMQMSATSFAVTEADLIVQSHGLFEWYMLMAVGPMVLPREGDMEAAANALRADLGAMVAELPAPTFPDATRRALLALIGELPNPAGIFSLSLRSDAGVGPARLMGYAMTGVPTSMEAAAPLFDGVKISIGWEPEDVP